MVRAKLPPGPLCDRTHARSRGANLSKGTSALCCCSTREEASCCQPPRSAPGSNSSGTNMRGRTPLTQSLPRWWVEPPWCRSALWRKMLLHSGWTVWVALQLPGKPRCNLGMSGEHHGQAVCPACTMSRDTRPRGAPEAHPRQTPTANWPHS